MKVDPIMTPKLANMLNEMMLKMVESLPSFESFGIDSFCVYVKYPSERWIATVEYAANQKNDDGFRPTKQIYGHGESPIDAFYDLMRFVKIWVPTLQ